MLSPPPSSFSLFLSLSPSTPPFLSLSLSLSRFQCPPTAPWTTHLYKGQALAIASISYTATFNQALVHASQEHYLTSPRKNLPIAPRMPIDRRREGDKDDIYSVAETALDSALGSADYGEARGKIIYGNLLGRELLEERHNLKERMNRLEDKQTKTDTKITDLQHRVEGPHP